MTMTSNTGKEILLCNYLLIFNSKKKKRERKMNLNVKNKSKNDLN